MAKGSQTTTLRTAAAALCVGLVVLSLPAPASAGFFDRLFGGLRRAVEAPPPREVVDPFTSLANHFNGNERNEQVRAENNGPSRAFCVRSCDGHFFPVQGLPGMSTAEACNSFCPAAETKVFAGSNIDYATAPDGSRYADMPNAFAYRKAIVKGCSCNGRTSFGLATLDAAKDPTLRPGDIVAGKTGLMAYTGRGGDKTSAANFTPVENYAGLSKVMREKLAETKVSQSYSNDVTPIIPAAALNARAEAVR